jgi:hypothetical protein
MIFWMIKDKGKDKGKDEGKPYGSSAHLGK